MNNVFDEINAFNVDDNVFRGQTQGIIWVRKSKVIERENLRTIVSDSEDDRGYFVLMDITTGKVFHINDYGKTWRVYNGVLKKGRAKWEEIILSWFTQLKTKI